MGSLGIKRWFGKSEVVECSYGKKEDLGWEEGYEVGEEMVIDYCELYSAYFYKLGLAI